MSCVTEVNFNRVVEILRFTPEQVQKYVKKFTEYWKESTGRTIWQHISSNLNIFSLCYVPVNCFIICTCLLHVLPSCAPFSVGVLPTRLTDIDSTAIKIFYFRHDDKYRNCDRDPAWQDIIYEPFDKLPDDAQADFKRLSLRSKRFQSSYCAKVRAEAKKRLKGEGEGRRGNACSQTPRFWKTPLDISRFGSFVNWQLVKIET